jgi:hypothetical protein
MVIMALFDPLVFKILVRWPLWIEVYTPCHKRGYDDLLTLLLESIISILLLLDASETAGGETKALKPSCHERKKMRDESMPPLPHHSWQAR